MLHQRRILPFAATLAVALLAACGGGGNTGSSLPSTTLGGTGSPTPAPTSAPATAAPAGKALATAQLAGAAGFVNAQSHTVYVFDADLAAPGTSTCNGQCATVWPSVAGTAGLTYPAPFSAIKRSDGTAQLTYAGRPLYTYIADSVAGSTAGDGISSFGATWHIARPQSAGSPSPSPSPTATPAPGASPY